MKIFLMLLGLFGLSSTNAYAAANSDTPPPGMPPVSAECKPVMEHMRASRKQIETLIQENKPTDIGNLVIADHKYLEQYPQCKPPHPPKPSN